MLSKEATNTNLIVFGRLMMGTKLVIYRTGSGHHYITVEVLYCKGRDLKQVQGDIIHYVLQGKKIEGYVV
jgi:hypothetical protein